MGSILVLEPDHHFAHPRAGYIWSMNIRTMQEGLFSLDGNITCRDAFLLWASMLCLTQTFPNESCSSITYLSPAWGVNPSLQTGCHGTNFLKHWESNKHLSIGPSGEESKVAFFSFQPMHWHSNSKNHFISKMKIIVALSLFTINWYLFRAWSFH